MKKRSRGGSCGVYVRGEMLGRDELGKRKNVKRRGQQDNKTRGEATEG